MLICTLCDNTVYLVIFACLNVREFQILGLSTEVQNPRIFIFFSSAIIIIIFARFLISRVFPPRIFAKIRASQILPDLQYTNVQFQHITKEFSFVSQPTPDIHLLLVRCWVSVVDGGPAFIYQLVGDSCF